jgi:hypothetical protein
MEDPFEDTVGRISTVRRSCSSPSSRLPDGMTGEVAFDPKRETWFEGSTPCRLGLRIRKQCEYSGSGRRSVEL